MTNDSVFQCCEVSPGVIYNVESDRLTTYKALALLCCWPLYGGAEGRDDFLSHSEKGTSQHILARFEA